MTARGRGELSRFVGDLGASARLLLAVVGLLWVVSALNWTVLGGSLNRFGVLPRDPAGAAGILLHPFLHVGVTHLVMNTMAFLVLGGMVLLRDARDFWLVTLLGIVAGGAGIWLVGHPGVHMGASGVIFAYLGYLLLAGWFDRRFGSIALSIFAFALWGNMLLGLSPFQRGISWEGHLFGFFGGVAGAWWRGRRKRR